MVVRLLWDGDWSTEMKQNNHCEKVSSICLSDVSHVIFARAIVQRITVRNANVARTQVFVRDFRALRAMIDNEL